MAKAQKDTTNWSAVDALQTLTLPRLFQMILMQRIWMRKA